jgi:4-oxalomesaconate tautomerase
LLNIEHPIGHITVKLNQDDAGDVSGAAIVSTTRKLFDGTVFSHPIQISKN